MGSWDDWLIIIRQQLSIGLHFADVIQQDLKLMSVFRSFADSWPHKIDLQYSTVATVQTSRSQSTVDIVERYAVRTLDDGGQPQNQAGILTSSIPLFGSPQIG